MKTPASPSRRLVLGSAAALGCAVAIAPLRAQTLPTLVAASNLKFAIEELAPRFERDTGHKLRLIFGSSGNFTSQILQGAPFHLFMSADEDHVSRLADAGKTADRGRIYAVGRIAIVVPKGGVLRADAELKDLAAALRDGRLQKFAIANPELAPYGARARDALQHAGLWPAIQDKLVFGENISQAAQFATSGAAQGGIVAWSLALAPAVALRGDAALIPEGWHRPLQQRMVLMKGAPPAARAFYDYVGTPGAQQVMARHGFAMPRD